MARGEYKATSSSGNGVGWKPLLILGGVAAGLYLISPGGRQWLRTGILPPASPDDELAAIAHEKGFANVAEYERSVRELRAEGAERMR
jgi:hypothetical protein